MRAAFFEEHGGPEVLKICERPDPEPGPDDALVEVSACGLNHLDIWVRLGGKRNFPLPIIPGSDPAGVVLEAPAGSGLEPGDEVVIYPCEGHGDEEAVARGDDQLCPDFRIYGAARDGGMAEKIAVPAANCFAKPKTLSMHEAAAVSINYITAWHMLVARAEVRAGERVLIQAAGSGVSTAAIQIASHLGARVLATSSTKEKLEHAMRCGAQEAVNYREEDVPARVMEFTAGRGADVVFDHVGEPNWECDLASLAKGGRLVFCGTTGGAEVTVNLSSVYFMGQSILGSTMGRRDELEQVLALMGEGKLKPVIDRVFPLAELAEAHRYLEDGKQTGKIIIDIGS
ncbi:MAG: zinc-binding dehydrogenase [Planctomycetota bacterium]|nr:zinc-binding dehydrogenase [Planctomycetota bacterium]